MTDAASMPPAETGGPVELTFDGPTGKLIPIVLVNLLLTVVTLGIYRFWAKTRVRRYFWSHLRLAGEPFEYTGTGLQLFLGFIIVMLVIVVPFFAISVVIGVLGPLGAVLVQPLAFLFILWISGVAVYRARRYRLGHTNWRGIRGAMTGSPMRFGWKFLGMILLLPLTLGLSYPWQTIVLNRQLFNDMDFGDRSFRFDARAGQLYKPFFLYLVLPAIVLAIVGGVVLAANHDAVAAFIEEAQRQQQQQGQSEMQLGPGIAGGLLAGEFLVLAVFAVFFAFYKLKELQVLAAGLSFEDVRFRFEASVGKLIRLVIGNVLIAVLTLSLGMDFVALRQIRFLFNHLRTDGHVDLEAIRQTSQAKMAFGEGLAEAFDVDAF